MTSPYKRFKGLDFTLRDYLALDRTLLANQRTLLAYVRTGLVLIVSGTTIFKFFDLALPRYLAIIIITIGAFTLIMGVIIFFSTRSHYTNFQFDQEKSKTDAS